MTVSSEPNAPCTGALLDASHVVQAGGSLALRASRCTACGQAAFPASTICPFCLSEEAADLPVTGAATLYTFTRVHVAPKVWVTPYCVGYADFPNGLRLLAKLADAGEGWRADQAVALRVVPAGEGRYRYYLEGATA
jgi:uncharacterized OB-fold protein